MKREVSYGNGATDLFVIIKGGKPELYDYEYDTDTLHEKCGGKQYYRSRSGCSGAGYLATLGELIPVGLYRVDTAHNEWQEFVPVGTTPEGEEIKVALPYASHLEDKLDILVRYPTVIKVGYTVVYTGFDESLIVTLKKLFTGGDFGESRQYKKTFSRLSYWGKLIEEEVTLTFYDLSGMWERIDPWEFLREDLSQFYASSRERAYQLLGVEEIRDGGCIRFVKTFKIGNDVYRGRILETDPVSGDTLISGWEIARENVWRRYYERDVHLVAVLPTTVAYAGYDGGEICSEYDPRNNRFQLVELIVPKLAYLLEPEQFEADVICRLKEQIESDTRFWNKID